MQSSERSNLLRTKPEHTSICFSGNYQTDYGGSGRVYEDYVRPVVAELVGTMLFVCGGVLCVFQLGQGDSTSGSISVAVGQGLMIVELVIAFGDISGGHFNPAVTMGALLAGAITPGKALLYVFGQLAGGLAGAGLSRGILPTNAYKTIGGGAHTLPPEVTVGEGMLCEVVLTAVLVLTAIVTAMDPRTKSCLAPVAIGFAVTVDVLAGMFISGASMNPARSFGPAVVVSSFTHDFWKYHYIYWVGPFLGSLASGVCYRFLLASPEKRLIFKD